MGMELEVANLQVGPARLEIRRANGGDDIQKQAAGEFFYSGEGPSFCSTGASN